MDKMRVAVVGAGVGGLVAALELARQGIAVVVLERGSTPGGKLRQQVVNGRAIDVGPTVFTMRPVFEEIFHAAGTSLAAHLKLTPLQILARHAWDDQARLDLFSDIERTVEAIGDFAGAAEAGRYIDFCQQTRRVYETLEHSFIRASRPNPLTLVGRIAPMGLHRLGSIQPFSNLWRALGRQFRDPRLQQLFGRYATYMGSSPFAAPATLMLIAHVERSGVWAIEGGMYRLIEALVALASHHGVSFRYATEAQRVIIRNGKVAGLALASGEQIEVDAVVINADPAAISAGLLGAEVESAVPRTGASNRSLSAVTWAMAARAEGFALHRHTVFFSSSYQREFNDIFKQQRLPEAPTVYICAQDRDDRCDFPDRADERLFCLVNAPPVGDGIGIEPAAIERCQMLAFDLLQRCGLKIHYDSSRVSVTSPTEFEGLFPGTGGALYGAVSHGWRASFSRPGARARFPGMYLAGGGTHPGAGVPMAALSGRQAALALLQDKGTGL